MDTILTTTLNDDRLGSFFERKSNADNIFRIIKNGVTIVSLDNTYIFNYLVRE